MTRCGSPGALRGAPTSTRRPLWLTTVTSERLTTCTGSENRNVTADGLSTTRAPPGGVEPTSDACADAAEAVAASAHRATTRHVMARRTALMPVRLPGRRAPPARCAGAGARRFPT